MTEKIKTKLENLPAGPGVYQFKDSAGRVIYVGKAKVLKNRVKSYFHTKTLYPRTEAMIKKIDDIEIITTDSEVEALILEINLIKEIKPRYNVNLKDDKSYPYIVITNEPYPRVFPTRRKRTDGSRYFGPYTDVKSMRYALKSVRDLFTIRSCNLNLNEENVKEEKFKVCLDYHIHKCDGPCVDLISSADYKKMIEQVEKLLNGKTEMLKNELIKRMEEFSGEENFEQAGKIRDKINALEVYSSKQKMAGEEVIDRDIFAVTSEDNDACGMILKIRDGKVIGKSHFYFNNVLGKETGEIIENLITSYYSKSDFIPDEIFLQKETENLESINDWLNKKLSENNLYGKRNVKIIIPKIGEKAKLVSMVEKNAKLMLDELKLAKLKREFIAPSLDALKRDLRLTRHPKRIECFDISHTQGTDTVASMVVFQDAKPKKSEYRKFKLYSVTNEEGKPDDFLSMREVIHRRFKRGLEEGQPLPDLIVIDGGKGQLSSAVSELRNLGIAVAATPHLDKENNNPKEYEKKVYIIGLAKKLEEIFFPGESDPYTIPKTSSGLKLLQRVRDEAHRFAIEFHRSLREKRTLTSELNQIKGIGEKTVKKLLTEFGSVEGIKNALSENEERFSDFAGKKVTEKIKYYFNL